MKESNVQWTYKMTNWNLSFKIESQVATIIAQQELNGWKFDVAKAHQHVAWLDSKTSELYEKIVVGLGYVNKPQRYCARPFNTDGSYSKKVGKFLGGEDLPIGGPFTYVAPILSEGIWLGERLIGLGWKPTLFSEKTEKPVLTVKGEPVPTLLKMDNSIGNLLGEWITYEKRRSTIENRNNPTKGWLNHVRDDGRISVRANPLGCNTGRMQPSVVDNVPKASPKVIFGKEMRELFIVEEGYKLVGYGASVLKARR